MVDEALDWTRTNSNMAAVTRGAGIQFLFSFFFFFLNAHTQWLVHIRAQVKRQYVLGAGQLK